MNSTGTASGRHLHAESLLTSSGAIRAAGNLTINEDNGAADAILTFGNDAAAETLRFSDTTNGFIFSDDVEVQGTLSGATLRILTGAIIENGNVGIGTTAPNSPLHVVKDAETLLQLTRNSDTQDGTVAATVGLLFGVRSVANGLTIQNKGAVLFKRTTSFGRGDLVFAVDNEDNNENASLEDAVMTLKAGGNVGIGTTGPDFLLDVYQSQSGTDADAPVSILSISNPDTTDNNVTALGFQPADSDGDPKPSAYLGVVTHTRGSGLLSTDFIFTTRNGSLSSRDEKVRITSDGNVGIGTTSPSTKIEVVGTISGSALTVGGDITLNADNGAADAILTFGNDAAAETLRFSDTTNGFIFSDDVEVQGTLSGASLTIMQGADSYILGNVGIGTTSPS